MLIRLRDVVTHTLKPHTHYTQNFLTRKLFPERQGRKRKLYCSFSACPHEVVSSENWYSLIRHYRWSDQKKETRTNFKKFTLKIWSKKISSDKFMICEKPIQAKPEHSQSEHREERYLHCLLTVLSHPAPPHLRANWHMQPFGNSVYYIWTWVFKISQLLVFSNITLSMYQNLAECSSGFFYMFSSRTLGDKREHHLEVTHILWNRTCAETGISLLLRYLWNNCFYLYTQSPLNVQYF